MTRFMSNAENFVKNVFITTIMNAIVMIQGNASITPVMTVTII